MLVASCNTFLKEYGASVKGTLSWGLLGPEIVGTDSHTTMVNGLSVLGWGVGGIEAEAGMLGQPISMLIPEVIGLRWKIKCQKELQQLIWF